MPQGHDSSVLQMSYKLNRKEPSEKAKDVKPVCNSTEEAMSRNALVQRIKQLEQLASQQKKRLDVLHTELAGTAAPVGGPSQRDLPIQEQVEAFALALAAREKTSQELLTKTLAANDRFSAAVKDASKRCDSQDCTCKADS
eukprot:CAMPEP_0172707614 /NCGR_PEP_ID=MMETSP1074-20121228/50077_1 /TAXON_ID=2916 /ORGANISM="Ceratium fusus, Strain PA161109" /LENGTH=140 /DNA_ID=CAMNT_0013530451 /DNA_START=148 /DNA_END=570 /DNA_ORIENTATION=-